MGIVLIVDRSGSAWRMRKLLARWVGRCCGMVVISSKMLQSLALIARLLNSTPTHDFLRPTLMAFVLIDPSS